MKITINNLELINHTWFASTIGIVLCKNTITGELKSYIKSVAGFNEEDDVAAVMMYGSSFPLSAANEIFK